LHRALMLPVDDAIDDRYYANRCRMASAKP
jgi:hypothetical protein